jgi:hypothetical protein
MSEALDPDAITIRNRQRPRFERMDTREAEIRERNAFARRRE